LDPANVGAYLNRGVLRLRQNDPDGALADFDKAFQLGPGSPTFLVKRGHAYADRKEYEKAFEQYDTALAIDPDLAEAHYGRGNIFKEQGKLDEALAEYNETIRLEPRAEPTYVNRGVVHQLKGEIDKAVADYTEAIRLTHPRVEAAYRNRGVAYISLGRYADAIADLDEAIRRKPDFIDAYIDRARALNAVGQSEKALLDYETVLRIGGDDARTFNLLAWMLAVNPAPSVRNGPKAISLATKACELAQWTNPAFLDTLAAAYAEAGNFAEAIRWQEKTLAMIAPADPNTSGMRERLELYQNNAAYHDEH